MKKTVSALKKAAAVCCCLTLTLQMAVLPAFAAGNPEEPGKAPLGAVTQTQPKFRFDMEKLKDGKVTESISGAAYAVNGSAELTGGRQGNSALTFNGTDTYINLGDAFQPKNAYTMMGWVKQAPNPADGQAIFYRGNSGKAANQLGLNVKNEQAYHAVAVGAGNNTFDEMFSPAKATVGKWHHIAVTRDGADVIIYIDGAQVFTKAINASDFAATDYPMYIGIDCDGSGTPYSRHAFKGAMDDLRLYDAAISAEEIAAVYEAENAFGIAQEATENGKLVLNFPGKPADVKQSDVTLAAAMDGVDTAVEVTSFTYDAEAGQATILFTPYKNPSQGEKTVVLSATYHEQTQSVSILLPGGTNKAPTAESLSVKNLSVSMLGENPRVKGMLEAVYTFADEDNDAEGDTKFQWQIADAPDGEFTDLSGICARTVILLDKYEGKYLRCRVTPADEFGNRGAAVFTPATTAPVGHTDGNPLTDWFYEAQFGVSHHFLSNYFNLPGTYADDSEKWDRKTTTWSDFVGQFDAEKYAKQVNETGAKYVLLTLGQNSGSYCAPNAVYDKYMREAGLLKEGEQNPKTASMENDMPMKIAKALKPYGIHLMLYLPSNPPHSASWDETGDPNGYGYFSDYLVTKKVFDYTPGQDGVPSQKARKVLSEMVEWWSEHYGDLVSGWWFDGFYHSGNGSQLDMSLEYNVSTLANAAKAGNPYSIVTFNRGLSNPHAKITDYSDYSSGEAGGLDTGTSDSRWVSGSTDCQLFHFAALGSTGTWQNRWGCKGSSRSVDEIYNARTGAMKSHFVFGTDLKVNVRGELDPTAFDQLKQVNKRIDKTPPTAPSQLTASQDASKTIRLSWQPSEETDGVLKGYNIYRDGEFLAFTPETGYIDTDTVEGASYTYTVKGVNVADLISDASNEATATAGKDTDAPAIGKAEFSSRTTVTLVFDEPVTKASAETVKNYTLPGATVTGAVLAEDGRTVTLTISAVSPDDVLSLHLANITDRAELGNTSGELRTQLSLRTHYYKFDDVSGNTVKDYAGQKDAVPFGTVDSAAGKNAGAAKLNGGSGVKIDSSTFAGSDSWTMSTWFLSQDSTESQTLFSGVASGTLGKNGVWVYIDKNSKKPCIYAEDGASSPTLTGSTAVQLNAWQHLAITYSEGTLTLYLNGENIGSVKTAGLDANQWKKELLLGSNTNGSYIHSFKGLMDEFKIYSTELTAEEIAAQAAVTEFNPVVYNDVFAFDKSDETAGAVTVKMDFNGYTVSKISCDGDLSNSSYTVAWDGIALRPEYLVSLKRGEHKFTVTFENDGKTQTADFAVTITEQPPVTDKEALTSLIEKFDKEALYTPASWAVFAPVLQGAKDVLNDEWAVQSEVNAAYNELLAASLKLVERPNKSGLKALIDEAEALDTGDCRPGKVKDFEKALAAAQKTYGDPNADLAAVTAATDTLLEAMLNLKDIVDRTELNKLVALLEKLDETQYFQDGFDKLKEAIAQAKLLDGDASVKQVQDAYKALQKAYGELVRLPDKTALANAVKNAETILKNRDDYMPSTIAGLDELTQKAKAVLNKPEATIDEVTAELNSLTQALAKVRVKEDRTALLNAIDRANKLDAEKYTVESYAFVKGVAAKAVLTVENGDATKAEIENALADLNGAMDNLVLLKDDNNGGSGSGNGNTDVPKTGAQTPSGALALAALSLAVLAYSKKSYLKK